MNKKTLIIILILQLIMNTYLFALNNDKSNFHKDMLWYNDSFLTLSFGADSFLHYQVNADGLFMPKDELKSNGYFVEKSLVAANLSIGGRFTSKSPIRMYFEYNIVDFKHKNVIVHPYQMKNVSTFLGVNSTYNNDVAISQNALGITFNYDFLLGSHNNMVIPYIGLSSFVVIRKLTNTNYNIYGDPATKLYTTNQKDYSNKETLLEIEPLVGLTLFKGYVSVEYAYAMQLHKHSASYSKIKLLANIPVL